MDPQDEAELVTQRGIKGNANQGGRRQVTLMSAERWAELAVELGAPLDPSIRRANLLLSGIDLIETRGRTLRIGGATLKINGETRPCERMEEAHPGLQAAMRHRWGGGAYAEVVAGGTIHVGDEADWAD